MYLITTSVYAAISDFLGATIKISICGNGIIEGGEDCEGVNLNGQTCQSLGFGPGTLSCDIACTFDTYQCSPAPTPTPTQIPTPTPTLCLTPVPDLTSTPTPTPIPASPTSSEETLDSSPAIVSKAATPTLPLPTITQPALPAFLIPFDPNGDGIISSKELFIVAQSWVTEWRQTLFENIAQRGNKSLASNIRTCDLNRNGECNVVDFSILMSYVGR